MKRWRFAALSLLWLTACRPGLETPARGPAAPVATPPAAPTATPPSAPVAAPERLHFAVYGDTRSQPDKHRAVVAQMVKARPEFVLQTGDLVGGDGSDPKAWDEAFEIIAPLRALGPYYMAMGNHDRGNPNVARQLDLPADERMYYTVSRGNCLFVVLNTNTIRRSGQDEEQVAWFKQQLRAASAAHVFVLMHHPPYTIGSYRPGDLTVRKRLLPILKQYPVDAVFSAHDHNYYRTRRDGITFIVTAGGGAPLYDQHPELAQEGDVYKKSYHFVDVTVTGSSVAMRAIDEQGRELDSFTLPARSKPAPSPQPSAAGG